MAHIALLVVYCSQVVHDWLSATLFTLVLLFYSGIISKKLTALLIVIVLWGEIAIKSPFSGLDPHKFKLDMNCF